MKKLFLSVALLALLAGPAYADDHKGGHKNKMDTNGDGAVSKSEFMAQQEERFKEMDANGDGKVEREEFKQAKEKWKEKRKDKKAERKARKDAKNAE